MLSLLDDIPNLLKKIKLSNNSEMSLKQALSSTINVIATFDRAPDNTFFNIHSLKSEISPLLPFHFVRIFWEHKIFLQVKVATCSDHPHFWSTDDFSVNDYYVHDKTIKLFIPTPPTPSWEFELDFPSMSTGGLPLCMVFHPHNLHNN